MNSYRESITYFPRNRAEWRKNRSRELPRSKKVKQKLFKGFQKGYNG